MPPPSRRPSSSITRGGRQSESSTTQGGKRVNLQSSTTQNGQMQNPSQSSKAQSSGTEGRVIDGTKPKVFESQGSRFEELNKMCKYCNKYCTTPKDPTLKPNAQCCRCEIWMHKACVPLESQDLEEQILLGALMCETCTLNKVKDHEGSTCSMDEDMESESESTMNTIDRQRAEYDQEIAMTLGDEVKISDTISTPEGPFEFDGPRTSSPRKIAQINTGDSIQDHNQHGLGEKLDQMMFMMTEIKEMKDDVKKLDSDIKQLSGQQKNLRNETNSQMGHMVQQTVASVFSKMDANWKSTLESDITKKIDAGIEKKVEHHIITKVNEKLKSIEYNTEQNLSAIGDTLTNNITKEVEHDMNEKLKTMDKKYDQRIRNIEYKLGTLDKMESKLDTMVEKAVESKTEQFVTYPKLNNALDEFGEKLWRRKNILVVNVPESQERSIEDRKHTDLNTVTQMFNKFIHFDENDIEGLPVRVGKVGGKPRQIRVVFKSEIKVRDLVIKARESNHLLNPEEKDNSKKIYINRDYTLLDRNMRKELLKTKKELEKGGEKWDIRGRNLTKREIPQTYSQAVSQNRQSNSTQVQSETALGINPQQQGYYENENKKKIPNSGEGLHYGQNQHSKSLDHDTHRKYERHMGYGLINRSFEVSSMEVLGEGISPMNRPQFSLGSDPMCRQEIGAVGGSFGFQPRPNFDPEVAGGYFGNYFQNGNRGQRGGSRNFRPDFRGGSRGSFQGGRGHRM